ncbi:serine/threonine protein kinase [Planctopirus limnophila DSM 3776]|uniref:Serine/threonine protein kinase n=1 Tax=Planctopirus limnophila (strain ATCC 43296 / DSM 3776 / IFAM 1008 / Mu 290) TaxID=521674 RepID=D5SP35_PLAL2|nr:serine/threonine protein kinase [Planctopirus limnophila]ADG68179.1 serine/threonine protein kinase [Planctopirus limnophila DSM 3776]
MREPPSSDLLMQLERLGITPASALAISRRVMQRLSDDLPAFDGLYLNEFVRRKLLTAWQAERIEAKQTDSLFVGSYLLRRPLGQHRFPKVFEAHRITDGARVALRMIHADRNELQRIEQALQRLVAALASLTSSRQQPAKFTIDPSTIACPQEVFRMGDWGSAAPPLVGTTPATLGHSSGLAVVSPFVEGRPLTELLVRRGRFPAAVVQAIGQQLFQALATLESLGFSEGALRLENLRLSSSSRKIVLVDPAIGGILTPVLNLHDTPHPAVLDLAAPERFSHQAAPSAQSDLYAVGCLCWQLLAGRPPFLMGDLYQRVAAHRQRAIPDIAEIAPEVLPQQAQAIALLTQKNPADRPASIREAVELWGPGHASILSQFERSFRETVPHFDQNQPRPTVSRGLWAAAVLLVAVGVFFTATRNQWDHLWLLAIPAKAKAVQQQAATSASPETTAVVPITSGQQQTFLRLSAHTAIIPGKPLPVPSSTGSLLLNESTSYEVAEISFVGDLTLEAAPGVTPQIVIGHEPLKITADTLHLRGIRFLFKPDVSQEAASRLLMTLRARNLTVTDCEFILPKDPAGPARAAIAWRPPEQKDATGGVAQFERVLQSGSATLLYAAETPRKVVCSQVLQSESAGLVSLGKSTRRSEFLLQLNRCTLRGTTSWLDCQGELASQAGSTPIEIEAIDTVWLPAHEHAAILRWRTASELRADWKNAVRISGEGTILVGHPAICLWDALAGQAPRLLQEEPTSIQGVLFGEVTFAGPASEDPADSQLVDTTAPLFSAQLPGIDAQQFRRATALQR